jgi:CRISPR-associated endoribonuclease Cas6
LNSNKDISQKEFLAKYHSAMNGYLYSILEKNEELKKVHGEKSFKGFCFGNIYPVKEGKIIEGKGYNLVISSPQPKIIEHLFFNIKEGSLINLGEGSFSVSEIQVRNFSLNKNSMIETMSIINLTEHKNDKTLPLLYEDNKGKYIEQLSKNLIKKYNLLREKKIDSGFKLFENVEIGVVGKRDNYSIPIIFNENKKFNVIGNKLYFKFNNITDEQLAVFQICFDAGFGERNAFGMGFMVTR